MCTGATSGRIRMTTITAWACVIAVLCSSIVEAKTNAVTINPPGEIIARVNQSTQILCSVPESLRVCRIEIPGEGSMVLSEGPSDDGIEYFGSGLGTGQCGVRIRVQERHNGIIKCSLTSINDRQEATASLKLVVAKPPKPSDVEIRMNSGNLGGNRYKYGETLEISCKASHGRPAANVSLYIDDELIGTSERDNFYDTNTDEKSTVQNASRTLEWTDNGKLIRCLVSHFALDRPIEKTQALEVYYPPQEQPKAERFGYVIGREGIINVTVYAHPRPRFTWRVNGENIDEGYPDQSNRLETSTAVDLGRGAWSVILTIDSVQKSDTEKSYLLEATNSEGSTKYSIILSTSPEPAGVDLDAGSIIGIVVGVLVLILIIFLVIFARATGRWCFAGRSSTRNLGESDFTDSAMGVSLLQLGKSKTTADVVRKRSDTESAGRYSRSEVDGASSRGQRKPRINLSRLFGRNKDKVSGADTDTMKTVVTIDDEKLQTVEPAVQEGRTTGEGGIVYAELDLTQQQQGVAPRRINEDKTEYAEILYTKPETEETANK